MSRGEWSYTANRSIFVPDVKIEAIDEGHTYVPLRGYSASLAVFDATRRCIGWIDTRTLGHENAGAWMAATEWKDAGL